MRCFCCCLHICAAALSLQLQHGGGAAVGGGGERAPPAAHSAASARLWRFFSRRRCGSTPPLALQQQPRDDAPHQYYGRLYGVTAIVALEPATRKAHVELRGVPLGGSIAGVGRLKNGEAGEVELEEAFAAALARRRVSIQSAAFDRHAQTVTVHVTVPFFGAQRLSLRRVV